MNLKMVKKYLLIFVSIVCMISCTYKQHQVCGYAFQYEATGKWGLVSTEGKLLTTDVFAYQPTSVINGMFAVPDKEGKYKLHSIDSPLLPVNEQSYHQIGHFFEDVTWAQETPYSPLLLIDKQGKVIVSTIQYPQYDIRVVYNFCNGLALFITNQGKYGYMDTHGNIAIPPIYDRANNFIDNVALVGMSNTNGYIGFQLINKDGKTRTSIRLDNCVLGNEIKYGLIPYKNIETGQCGFIDYDGLPFINLPKEVYYAKSIQNGKIIFQDNNGYGIIHHNGRILLNADYNDIKCLENERFALLKSGKWSLADDEGNSISNLSFQYIGKYHTDNYAIAKQEDCYFFINQNGEQATPETFASLIDEPTAFYGTPQYFIYKDNNDNTTDKKEQSNSKKQTNIRNQARTSSINSDAWKSIAKESPFYEEANKVLNGNLEVKDVQNRQTILNYVEHLRTSYTTKDIDFLEQLFSENALIIVGTIIKMIPQTENHYLPPEHVIYNVKSKREYLDKLKVIFQTNQTIELTFSDFHIKRHPTKEGIYGVVLRQGYKSDHYSDDGYLFLLWDFRNETAPKIHVRTWQPYITPDNTPLSKDEVFDIRNFNLQ